MSGSRPAPSNQHLVRIFGDRVRDARLALGISQEELAHRAGIHRTFIGQLERAEANPTLATIIRIAQALGTTPGNLLDGMEGLKIELGDPRRRRLQP